MSRAAGPVVIVGVSTRALAESAVRAGRACVTVDAFGDRDQRMRVARNVALPRDLGRRYSAAAAVAAAARLSAESAAYVANLENHPAAVRRLARGRRLLGNTPATLVRARDPVLLAEAVRRAGGRTPALLVQGAAGVIPAPGEHLHGDSATATELAPVERAYGHAVAPSGFELARAWLRKPRRGGGGSGVSSWRPGDPLNEREVVQEFIDGPTLSAAFVADGRRAAVLGIARQIVGDRTFGATGFRFCGALFPHTAPDAEDAFLLGRVHGLADALTRAFRLRGVGGFDFVLRDGQPYVLELNPRYTASMELMERALGVSIYDVHERACGGRLPDFDAATAPPEVYGKSIVFARRDLVMGDTDDWLSSDDVRDVPFAGEHIARGHPVCTVFARGADAETCYGRLAARAEALERELDGGDAHEF